MPAYFFGDGRSEFRPDGGFKPDKDTLGGKGANLHSMTEAGISVPPGFTIPTTETNRYFVQDNGQLPDGLMDVVMQKVEMVEAATGNKFGDEDRPQLFSVRSGAKFSMPGMMDTILNLGLNNKTVLGLAKAANNERFAWDSYRRFIQMFSNVVLGVKKDVLEEILSEKKVSRGVKNDTELTVDDLKELVAEYKAKLKELGAEVPQDERRQLELAIEAVMKSSNNERAIVYKRDFNIPKEIVSAVNVQAMVFGNMGEDSATGVGFTRNPETGANEFYGEFLSNAQGEDVVAGVRTPLKLKRLAEVMPEAYAQLREVTTRLEKFFRNVQDFEFTIERGKLYMLQTRDGKRSAQAAVNIAVDLVEEGAITIEEALMMIEPEQMSHLLHPVFDPEEKKVAIKAGRLLGQGINASPGAAVGRIEFTAEAVVLATANDTKDKKTKVILVRKETNPDDISGMKAAQGILTATGGATSHAALVGRQMGKPAVVGFSAAEVDEKARTIRIGDRVFKEGDILSIDGTTGEVFAGEIMTLPSEIKRVVEGQLKAEDSPVYQRYMKVLGWAKEAAELEVWANADTAKDVKIADAFEAQGVGLARTEHMFFGDDRIPYMVAMILSETPAEKQPFLDKILAMQRSDFISLFEVMKGRPVTIRTIDPPLHEFLPKTDADIDKLLSSIHSVALVEQLERKLGISKEGVTRDELGEELWLALREKVKRRSAELHEANPMMGHRGTRLGITNPEITAMQARAIFEAAFAVARKGIPVKPKIMIPLVGFAAELKDQATIVREVHAELEKEHGPIAFQLGTMIEVPRGGLTADEIALLAEFFSFGTNDLHQYTLGFSRDDAGKFIAPYIDKGIIPADPTQKIDQPGTGKLMWLAVQLGRETRPDLEIGICGEHGGEPTSVEFCHALGLNYVSASPYRIPVARMAAAQAWIKERRIEDELRKSAKVLQEASK
ncbi:pyruvate, phosphate dikinase [candidate division WOR-1 bacterium RIFCSPHIGHO2_01_FULL_53_15]|uniref:Pyruvate, phosphate dikinase n=1 Tax=candidate division WOR-1 bacterium RIFCSPHIGHO2_01_FULL_53_15 TaxID=1802564 RepID=A0A1F4Q1E4_UNCSA|nr:MAG: pyruvate, phosphate dikinase [candidate division WOR-1 bacterium RIFCSPHIGHO2_01_FULL_53_15]OGC13903.1 MAG: pyruvate, phosphate dikinase [candidate division WOR-1 bacterium RIFCSPHIGHO2_02_FULL_53_26]